MALIDNQLDLTDIVHVLDSALQPGGYSDELHDDEVLSVMRARDAFKRLRAQRVLDN